MPLLTVENLRTHFDTDDGVVRAVDGVSFSLEAGQSLGIVGESGSGKSVLSLSIMQLIKQPPGRFVGGSIMFEGQDLLRASRRTLENLRGNRVAMIFQDPMTALNPFLTVGRQLTEVLERHKRCTPQAAAQGAIEMLERVGLSDASQRLRQYPHQFSGGMRQRVMIAMALLCEPALLIADEPTTALDVTIQAQILGLIRTLQHDMGTSLILITHDLGVVAGLSDRIAVMYAGRVVEEALPQDLYDQARHPYSRGLLQCVPRLEGPSHAKLTPIHGMPPNLSALPPGCPFAPRCQHSTAECSQRYPPVTHFARGQWAACWHPQLGEAP